MKGLSLLLSAVLLTAGCADTDPAAVKNEEEPYLRNSRVQWHTDNLKVLLSIEKVVADRTDNGLLRVRAAVRNKTRDNLWVEIKTTFLDEDKLKLEETNWEPVMFTARTVDEYTVRSLGARAQDYMIQIRDPRKSDLR